MKIVYACLAVKERYNELAQKLCETWVQFAPDSGLVILTDDLESFAKWRNKGVIVLEDRKLAHYTGTFNCNVKSLLLSWIYKNLNPHTIILCDADIYLTQKVDNTWFKELPAGINVCIGDEQPISNFPNQAIKAKALAFNPDETKVYKHFIERCLIIRADEFSQKLVNFIKGWKDLYIKGMEKKVEVSSEIFEINNACEYADFPINNLGATPLKACLWTREPNGETASALR